MTDPGPVLRLMADMGINIADLAGPSGLTSSYIGRQLRGDLPLQRRVQRALVEVLDSRAMVALPHVARLLRREGEAKAAEACERVWERRRQQTQVVKDRPTEVKPTGRA